MTIGRQGGMVSRVKPALPKKKRNEKKSNSIKYKKVNKRVCTSPRSRLFFRSIFYDLAKTVQNRAHKAFITMSNKSPNQCKRLLPAVQQSINPKKPKHWSLSLLDSMKDPNSIVKSTEKLVVIRDKFPKAKVHYLVLPHEEISGIYKLNRSHVNLLEDFGQMYKKIQEDEDYSLKVGFHAVPSMQRLHMHIISTDMVSPCLKTKIHWNSFTTEFFLPYDDVLRELKENGLIRKMSSESHKNLMSTELQCNQCSYKPKNMPQLKEHLLSHSK